ncbi:MAG TPA: TlpA disulfide reductase family protein [Bryobacteraceae bacterium]|nr:TlpA disulfide reductase family protein [Bryobacteraceae bacterium]
MKKILIFVALTASGGTVTFPTGPAELLENDGGIAFPMDAGQYAKFTEQNKSMAHYVSVVKKPAGLSPAARYGYNFVVGGNNRGWILDGDAEHGWVLYLDWKGDGDLSEVKAQKLERIDKVSRLDVEVSDGELHWACRFEVLQIKMENKEQFGVKIDNTSVRKGVIELGGNRYPFQLTGSTGKYNGEYDHFVLERFGNGAADSYKATDRFLNLGGKSYEFTVDKQGASVTLTELAETRPDRLSLKIGSNAPGFTATDLEGVSRRLVDYRGRMVLVEFWSTSCGPCREEAPRMLELYRGLDPDKIEFLGVSSDESEATLRNFLSEFKLTWPQVREPFEGPIHQVYRAAAEPTYFLIGADSAILDTWVGSGETIMRVTKALAAQR